MGSQDYFKGSPYEVGTKDVSFVVRLPHVEKSNLHDETTTCVK